MPIENFPFSTYGGGVDRPYLLVRITNPHTGLHYITYGVIDTGADECAIPALFAPIIGHNIHAVIPKEIQTGNGNTCAYPHMTKFEIFHPDTGEIIYTTEDTPVDFMPNLHVTLLGVKNFLGKFILNINYPKRTFSIKYP
ncbi:MAG: hypothetical protein Q7J12_02585 [Syntrophales bacterium]|nr:hypothetical protein [Syntrophales bacterium]